MEKEYEKIENDVKLKECKLPIIYNNIYKSYEDVLVDMLKILENIDKIYLKELLLLEGDINLIDKQKILFTILYNIYLNIDIYLKINTFKIYNFKVIKRYHIKGLSIEDNKILKDNTQNIIYNTKKIEELSAKFTDIDRKIDNKIITHLKKEECLNILKYIEECNENDVNIETEVLKELKKSKSLILKDNLFNFDCSKRYLKENFNKFLKNKIKLFIKKIEKLENKSNKVKEKSKKEEKIKGSKKISIIDNNIILMQYQEERSELIAKLNKEINEYRESEVNKNTEIKDKKDLKKYYSNFLEIKKINTMFDAHFKEYLIIIVKMFQQEKRIFKINTLEEYLKTQGLIDAYSQIYKSFKENKKLKDFLKNKRIETEKKVYDIYSPFLKDKVTFNTFKNVYKYFDIYKEYGRCLSIQLNKTKKQDKEKNVKILNKDKIYDIKLLDKKYGKKILKQLEIFGDEYLKVAKEYIGEDNIYYSEEANFRSYYEMVSNIIFLNDTESLAHELGHAIHHRFINDNTSMKNEMLSELYSQMLEYVEIMNIISNKEIKTVNLKVYSIANIFLNIEDRFKIVGIQNKIAKYLEEIFLHYDLSTLSKEEQDKQIEKNIDKLINNLTKKEQRDLFLTGKYKLRIFETIKYFFPLYLIPTIYKKIKIEYEEKKNNKHNVLNETDSYRDKYIQSMKCFNEKTLEEILNLLEVNPINCSDELINNYIEAIEKIYTF